MCVAHETSRRLCVNITLQLKALMVKANGDRLGDAHFAALKDAKAAKLRSAAVVPTVVAPHRSGSGQSHGGSGGPGGNAASASALAALYDDIAQFCAHVTGSHIPNVASEKQQWTAAVKAAAVAVASPSMRPQAPSVELPRFDASLPGLRSAAMTRKRARSR